MRTRLLLFAVLPLLGGCATQWSLRDNTLQTSATLTDLNYHMVLDNVALIAAHPSFPAAILLDTIRSLRTLIPGNTGQLATT